MPHTLFQDVQIIVWDFDGTLYRQKLALWDEIRAGEIRVIMKHTGWSEKKASEEFYKVYKVITPSGTKTVSIIAKISNTASAIETAAAVDYAKYLKPDARLAGMFRALSRYRHFMLVNGTQESVAKGLKIIGLDPSTFEKIVTSEVVGETKPSEKGFRYIMKETGLPAGAHMMIGDREPVDLVPAHILGMRTCLVWSETTGKVADVTLPTVYEVADMLGYMKRT